MALSGETDAIQSAAATTLRLGDSGKNVWVFNKPDGRWHAGRGFLDFLRHRRSRTPVCHRSTGNEDRGTGDLLVDCGEHLIRRANIPTLHATRGVQAHRPCDQAHLCAGFTRRPGQGEAHFSTRQVGDAAYWVDRLIGRPGSNQNMLADQGLGLKKCQQLIEQLQRFEHAPVTGFTAGLLALSDRQDRGAIRAQLGHIALRGRVSPHLAVHGRREQQGKTRQGPRQTQQTQQVVCPALHQLSHEIRTCRRNQAGIGRAAQRDVQHVVIGTRVPLGVIHGTLAQCLHGDRGDELGRSLSHHHLHGGALLDQGPAQLCGLIAGNAASQTQQNMFPGKLVHGTQCSRAAAAIAATALLATGATV